MSQSIPFPETENPGGSSPWYLRYGALVEKSLYGQESLDSELLDELHRFDDALLALGPVALEDALNHFALTQLEAPPRSADIAPPLDPPLRIAAMSETEPGSLYAAMRKEAKEVLVEELVQLPDALSTAGKHVLLRPEGGHWILSAPTELSLRLRLNEDVLLPPGSEQRIYPEVLRAAEISFEDDCLDGPTLVIDKKH